MVRLVALLSFCLMAGSASAEVIATQASSTESLEECYTQNARLVGSSACVKPDEMIHRVFKACADREAVYRQAVDRDTPGRSEMELWAIRTKNTPAIFRDTVAWQEYHKVCRP